MSRAICIDHAHHESISGVSCVISIDFAAGVLSLSFASIEMFIPTSTALLTSLGFKRFVSVTDLCTLAAVKDVVFTTATWTDSLGFHDGSFVCGLLLLVLQRRHGANSRRRRLR